MPDLSMREWWLLAPIAAVVLWMGVYPESFLAPMRADVGVLLPVIDLGQVGDGGGAIPKQVLKFFREEPNRDRLRGVIAAGNTNFGAGYGLAGDIIARKCDVPHLYRFELFGTPDDVRVVNEGLDALWRQ